MILSIKNEVWKDVDGYEGIYQVSNTGKIRSLDRKVYNHFQKGKELRLHNNGHGYYNVSLSGNDCKNKHVYIHILVAKAFIPNPNNYSQVNHKDFNKENNHVENLEWVSPIQNKMHYRKSKFCKEIEKSKNKKHQNNTLVKIYKNFDNIFNLWSQAFNVIDIAKELGVGKDFVADVLNLYKFFMNEKYRR